MSTRDEAMTFLADGARIGRLATVSGSGDPHVVPIWYEVDGARLLVHTQAESHKARNIVATGKYAMTVDVDTMPYKGVTVTGPARVASNDEIDSIALVKRLAVAYVGPEGGPGFAEYVASMPGEHVTLVLDVAQHESWDFSG